MVIFTRKGQRANKDNVPEFSVSSPIHNKKAFKNFRARTVGMCLLSGGVKWTVRPQHFPVTGHVVVNSTSSRELEENQAGSLEKEELNLEAVVRENCQCFICGSIVSNPIDVLKLQMTIFEAS